MRPHILRIFKEGMHNILKHAEGCKNVILNVECINGMLEMILSDDGKGFVLQNEFAGNGLKNMNKRAQEIKSIIEFNTQPGAGTKMSLKVKLS